MRNPERRQRLAFSLIELLVAGGLSLLVGTILVLALVFFGSSLARQSRHSEAQRNVLMVVNNLREMMRSADADSVFCQPNWVSVASWALPDGSLSWSDAGETLWVKRIILYYDPSSQQVRCQTLPITPPATYLPVLQWTSFVPGPSDRLLAREISGLTLTVVPTGGFTVDVISQVNDACSELVTTIVPSSTSSNPDASATQ